MTEKEKMQSGHLYDPSDPELVALARKGREAARIFNTFPYDSPERNKYLDEAIPNHGEETVIQGPLYVDYGCFTEIGDRFYANYNLTILDVAPVKIGNDVFFGPNVSLLTPMHALRYQERNCLRKTDGSLYDLEYGKPITIGDNCWLAGNVTVLGGVSIGEGSVIGAGSVVTKDIPPHSLAYGNPCRVIRKITEADSLKNRGID